MIPWEVSVAWITMPSFVVEYLAVMKKGRQNKNTIDRMNRAIISSMKVRPPLFGNLFFAPPVCVSDMVHHPCFTIFYHPVQDLEIPLPIAPLQFYCREMMLRCQ